MMGVIDDFLTHAAACRACRAEGRPLPVWRGGPLADVDLSGANLRGAVLTGAEMRRADLTDADLRGAVLRDADLRHADLTDVDLSGANLRGAVLRGANLRDADLRHADLTDADLRDADLRGAVLRGANLRDADLRGALIAAGTITAHTTGRDGGYAWHALRLQDGGIILQYGCERHALPVWQARGPEYSAQHGHDEAHWAVGPAVAIAAAVALGGAA